MSEAVNGSKEREISKGLGFHTLNSLVGFLESAKEPGSHNVNDKKMGSANGKEKTTRKRNKACIRCRNQKLKCQFTVNSNLLACDRCQSQGEVCKFETKVDDKEWKKQAEVRMEKIENLVSSLMSSFADFQNEQRNFKSGDTIPVSKDQKSYPLHPSSVEKNKKRRIGHFQDLDLARNAFPSENEISISKSILDEKASLDDAQSIRSSLTSDHQDTQKGVLFSDNFDSNGPNLLPNQFQSPDSYEPMDLLQVFYDDKRMDKCFSFFCTRLAKYLPIFIFNYIPHLTPDIRKKSSLLFTSIVAISSLFHPKYQPYHQSLRKELELLLSSLSPSTLMNDDGLPYDLDRITYDMLGCIIAAAWLGGDLGFRCCLIASDLAGRLNPEVLDGMHVKEHQRRAIFAFSLTSYIIERRLRISYVRPYPMHLKNDKSVKRDYSLPRYLSEIFAHNENNVDSTELKLNANVELCAITMILQTELGSRMDITAESILSWSIKLDKWLADWIGRLTTHLNPSSAKPLLLTYHFAKLFLHIQALNHINPEEFLSMNKKTGFISWSEIAATDIIEMLIYDEDIRRLISLGPVFYPTIFVTAAATLLKIVTLRPYTSYEIDEEYLMGTAEKAYNVLCECIPFSILPCYETVHNLGNGIKRVKERLSTKNLQVNTMTTGESSEERNHIKILQLSPNNILNQNDHHSSILKENKNSIDSNAAVLELSQKPRFQSLAEDDVTITLDALFFDSKNDSWPFLASSNRRGLSSTGPRDSKFPQDIQQNRPEISDYRELWETELIDDPMFFMDAFNTELLKSLYESPPHD
ncbi:uncharacterized protein PRCAT00002526001 [Priceomyces carsonii]|uniref:uncharacterized protein n=1 Tax=Priceomyces carsonii TaxID=28549 RepID=UPI002ED7C308|nr:unnamed protein product [Priceomyces carsonii]